MDGPNDNGFCEDGMFVNEPDGAVEDTNGLRIIDPDTGVQVGPEAELLSDVALILAERGAQYGPPVEHHGKTAAMLTALWGVDVSPRMVSEFFEVDKLVRRQTSPGKLDHYMDQVGYACISWGHALREDG